jgi:hypothetical protein
MRKFLGLDDDGPPAPQKAKRARTKAKAEAAPPLTTFYGDPTPGPVFAKAGPPNPFKEFGKETRRVKYHDRTREVALVRVQPCGKVVGDCRCCTKTSLSIARFRPPECNNNGRRAPAFDAAVARLEEAVQREDVEEGKVAVKEVAEARNVLCDVCQEVASKLSPAVQACKDFWVATRREACQRQDGCANKECPMRGMDAELVLQWNHYHGARDEDVEKRKTHQLSDYFWWSCNGGVEAMRDEYDKGGQFICGFCHALDENSSTSRRIADPARVEELPDGKSNGTTEEVAQYERKRAARITAPKYAHVDAEKRRRGKCFYCERKVKPGEEVCFDYDHRDATTKWGSRSSKGGVAGLCNSLADAENPHKSPDVFGRLDAETDLCLLACINCHKLRTNHPDSDVWARILRAKRDKRAEASDVEQEQQ